MSGECLIDFDPSPLCPAIGYDPKWDDSPWYDFDERYEEARRNRFYALVTTMYQRVLTPSEEVEAVRLGRWLTEYNDVELSNVWFQQRRLQMLARGVNIQ